MTEPCVAICTPFHDRATVQYMRSLQQLWKPNSASEAFGHRGCTHLLDTYTHAIVEARTILTEMALAAEPRVTHVLWVDSDMEFPQHALKRLLDHDLPIVGGLCHNRRVPYAPILFKKHRDRDGLGFVYHYPPGALLEVDATGTGFLLVAREVFEKIAGPGGDGPGTWWRQIRTLSEDLSFCERAKDLGYKIFVDCGLEIGHVGEVVVYSDFARKNRPFQIDRWAPEPEIARDGEPVASVIIPTFNQKLKYLRAAALSAAYQTVPVEVIIVDDGSTDDLRVPVDGWPPNVRVVRHVSGPEGAPGAEELRVVDGEAVAYFSPAGAISSHPWGADTKFFAGAKIRRDTVLRPPLNRGIAEALNTGVRAMSTDWFCWLSSDDLLDPRKVETQLAHLRASGGGKLSFHRYQVFRTEEEGFARYSQMPLWSSIEDQMRSLSRGCDINGSTIMVHRSVFDDVGHFNPEFRYGQDWEWFCRVGERYFWYGISEILGSRREGENLTAEMARADTPEALAKKTRRDREDAAIRERYRRPGT